MDSSISTGDGDDSLSIIGLAEGEDSYINYEKRSSKWNNDSWSSYEHSHIYTSAYAEYNSIREYSGNHNSESDNIYISSNTYNRNYKQSRINNFGSAFGAKNSTIELGNGDNQASISANGGEIAEALSNSSLKTGKGDDLISLSATAFGEDSLIDQNQYISQHSHKDNYASQSEST